jgi:ABC-type uncharacterized transport system substrate-binding protein
MGADEVRHRIKRRDFFALVASGAALWPGWARAAAKPYRIASLQLAANWRQWPISRAVFAELRRLGYVEGQNLVVEDFISKNGFAKYRDVARVARAAVAGKPDAIVAAGEFGPALLESTRTIPIVIFTLAVQGITSNLARPPGNLTGVSFYPVEVFGKQLQILKEAVPSASRVGLLMTRIQEEPPLASWRSKLRGYAATLGISLMEIVLRDETQGEIERTFRELAHHPPDALLVGPQSPSPGAARLIARLAAANRLPTMYPYPIYTEVGGLMAYTVDAAELGRQVADDVDRVLHGTRPGDIPIYQASHYRFIVSLKAARAIGFTFPREILAQADEVIQ